MYFKYSTDSGGYAGFLLGEYFTVKNVVVGKGGKKLTYNDISSYIKSIACSAKNYYLLQNPEQSKYGNKVKEWLDKLNRLGFGSFLPILMAALEKNVTEDNLVKLLKSVERFNFLVFRLSQRRSNTRNNHYLTVSSDYYGGKLSTKKLIDNVEFDIDGEDDDYYYGWYDLDMFKLNMKNNFERNNGFYSWVGINYFLYEYELFLQGRDVSKVTWNKVNNETIEHILPQEKSDPYWQKRFGGLKKKEKESLCAYSGPNWTTDSDSKWTTHSDPIWTIYSDVNWTTHSDSKWATFS